jgi:hypothetical protein
VLILLAGQYTRMPAIRKPAGSNHTVNDQNSFLGEIIRIIKQ